MNILLAAVNAKYIHSNPAVYSLRAYAGRAGGAEIRIGEYTVNQAVPEVLADIYRRRPDLVGFSCYIWNISFVKALIRDLAKVLPGMPIWLGGPEASFDCAGLLAELTEVKGIMRGEGEETFACLAGAYERAGSAGEMEERLFQIQGLTFRDREGKIHSTPDRPPMDLSRIPFVYESLDPALFQNRIIYYESSRGCPFSCSYCLSSVDKALRFRDLELVRQELDFFLEQRAPQVKFVDRTFNCKKSHAMAVWEHILSRDNGVTNFHFEIAADLLDEEQMELLSQMRPGLVQLEIGVQTANPQTLEEIRRRTDVGRIGEITARINGWGNIHQHLDLIAGLPWEGLGSFRESFNRVYAMRPEQLQLGFLKVLKGSHMARMAEEYGLIYSAQPPYEVLGSRWLDYGEFLELKGVEEMTEVYYNSRQFIHSIRLLEEEFSTAYAMFAHMAAWYREHGLWGISHSRLSRFEFFWQMVLELGLEAERREIYRDALVCDLYLRENAKSRPSFARDQGPFKERLRRFFEEEKRSPRYLSGYEGYDARQMAKMAHGEVLGDGSMILFDYRNRDPLSHNASVVRIEEEAGCSGKEMR